MSAENRSCYHSNCSEVCIPVASVGSEHIYQYLPKSSAVHKVIFIAEVQ